MKFHKYLQYRSLNFKTAVPLSGRTAEPKEVMVNPVTRFFLTSGIIVSMFASVYGQSYTISAKNYSGKESLWNDGGNNTMAVGRGDASSHMNGAYIWYNNFAGADGSYHILFDASVDDDCATDFKIYAGAQKQGRLLASGKMPVGGQSGYNQRDYDLGGGHTMNKGEIVNVWANSAGKCYSRWLKLVFTLEGGSGTTPTKVTYPPDGTDLEEGKTYTLTGTGDNLVWSYDASSDGQGEITIGSGGSVDFVIPAGVTGAKTLRLYLKGNGGNITQNHTIILPTGIRVFDAGNKFLAAQDVFVNPNPFSQSTTLSFELTQSAAVTVNIFDLNGSVVKVLANTSYPRGAHVVIWDGRNDKGIYVDRGVYYYSLQINDGQTSGKLLLNK